MTVSKHSNVPEFSLSWKVSNKHYPVALMIISCPALEISLDRNMDMTSAIGGKTPSAGDGGTLQVESTTFQAGFEMPGELGSCQS